MNRKFLGFDIPAYRDRLQRAVARYGRPKDALVLWLNDSDEHACDHLRYMEPSAGLCWQCYLYNALLELGINQRPDLATITILDQRWHFGERHWNFQPGKIEYQVRRALKGLNYLVMIEFEIYRNVTTVRRPLGKAF